MKAGKSSAVAAVLPSLSTTSLQALKVGSSVAIPRISSTSCITGTGFMKWNPMNFSGRSVRLARRVIEIDEVLEVRIVCGLQMRHQIFEDRLFDGLAFGRGLDDQIGLGPDP